MKYVNLYTLRIFTPTKKWQKYWVAQEYRGLLSCKLTWFHPKFPSFHLPYHDGCSIATLFFCPSVWPYAPWSTLPILGMVIPPLMGIPEFLTNRYKNPNYSVDDHPLWGNKGIKSLSHVFKANSFLANLRYFPRNWRQLGHFKMRSQTPVEWSPTKRSISCGPSNRPVVFFGKG